VLETETTQKKFLPLDAEEAESEQAVRSVPMLGGPDFLKLLIDLPAT